MVGEASPHPNPPQLAGEGARIAAAARAGESPLPRKLGRVGVGVFDA